MTRIESTPVWGVDSKNAVVAPLLAPCFFSEAATGITLQEHKGRGIPKTAALKIGAKAPFPRCFFTQVGDIIMVSIPAAKNPKSR